ncbi:MAG: hypothetical protein WA737_07295 [Candidatus Acidiferrales bacterium]
MTGKRYYLTTIEAWRRNAPRFATSHWIALGASTAGSAQPNESGGKSSTSDDQAPILVVIEADEGAHLALEDDSTFSCLPHPLAQQAISGAAQAALAGHGVAPGTTMFDVAETAGRIHPLLRHRVF